MNSEVNQIFYGKATAAEPSLEWLTTAPVHGFAKLFRELVLEFRTEEDGRAECASSGKPAKPLKTPFSNFLLLELNKEQSHIGWLDRGRQTFMVHSMVGLASAYTNFTKKKHKNPKKRVQNALNENVKKYNMLIQLDKNTYQFKFLKQNK